MKKSSRWTILVRAIALHGESFHWAAVSTEYKPLMLNMHSTRIRLAPENVEQVLRYLRAVPYVKIFALYCTVQSTCNVSLEGDCSQASTCGSASIHTLHFECSRMFSSQVSTRTHLHSRVNALVSRNDFWRLFNARATGKICWNLEWRCVLKPRVPTYSS